MDCMEYMRQFPDKHFELAVVDPPYGIGEDGGKFRGRKGQGHRILPKKNWDRNTPEAPFFDDLRRVSKNQIIWGGNYFSLPPSRCWIFWDKLMGGDFADGELAWTSFDAVVRKFTKCNKDHGHIHPTQKPVALYKWLLSNYAKPGDKILDTHLGSGSSRIASYDLGFDFYATELDKDYFDAQEKRFQNFKSQLKLF